jgi:hypothetical protein
MKSFGRYVSIPPRPQNELSDHQPLNRAPEQEKWRPPDFDFTQKSLPSQARPCQSIAQPTKIFVRKPNPSTITALTLNQNETVCDSSAHCLPFHGQITHLDLTLYIKPNDLRESRTLLSRSWTADISPKHVWIRSWTPILCDLKRATGTKPERKVDASGCIVPHRS